MPGTAPRRRSARIDDRSPRTSWGIYANRGSGGEVGILKKRGAKLPKVKILSGNDVKFALKAKLTVEGCQVSATTKETIEKAGGEVK